MLEEDGFKGYDSHKGHPCILQSVNSMFNNAFTENMEQVYLDHREYRGQPTEPLLLLFIQQLQEYPLSSNSIIDLHTLSVSWFQFVHSFVLINLFTLIYVTLNQNNLPLVDEGTYQHFSWGSLANHMQDGSIYLHKEIKNVQSSPLLLKFCTVLSPLVSLLRSYLQAKRNVKLPPSYWVAVTQFSYSITMPRMNKSIVQVLEWVNYLVEAHTILHNYRDVSKDLNILYMQHKLLNMDRKQKELLWQRG